MSNIDEIENRVQDAVTGSVAFELWRELIKELREVRAELEALKASASRQAEAADIFAAELERKYTVPDGYRVMLIHESE